MAFYKLFKIVHKRADYDKLKIFMWACMHREEIEEKREYYENKAKEIMGFKSYMRSQISS